MAAPTINESPAYEVIASGAAYAKTLTATNTPTSWALTGQPAGVTINNSGAISGSSSVTAATAYTFSATATNGDGTSAAVTWLVLVVPSIVGVAQGSFARAIDLDLNFGTLQIPGVGSPLPVARSTSPATTPLEPAEFDDETRYLTRWTVDDRFALSLGAAMNGVLQDLDISNIAAVLRAEEGERGISIGEGDLTATGSGATARFETMIYLDPAELDGIVSAFEGPLDTTAPLLLGISIEVANDARDYDSALQTETIATLTQSSNVVDSFDINLPSASEITSGTKYDIEIKLICPTDTGLNVTLNRQATITWSGSAYVLGDVTGDDTDTGASTNAIDWDTTLSNSSLTCDATGFVVGTTVTATAQSAIATAIYFVVPIGGSDVDTIEVNSDLLAALPGGSVTIQFNDGAIDIGSPVVLTDGDSAADIKAAIEAEIGETVSVTMDSGADTFRIDLDLATAVGGRSILNGGMSVSPVTTMSTVPSYANTYVTVQITGVEMPEKSKTITSAAVPVLIERKMTRT